MTTNFKNEILWTKEDLIIDFDRDAISVLTKRRENLWSIANPIRFLT